MSAESKVSRGETLKRARDKEPGWWIPLRADEVEHFERVEKSLERITKSVAGQSPSQVRDRRVYLVDADVIDACVAIRFQCPACGKSFNVAAENSERIYCGSRCAALAGCPPPESSQG